MLKVATFSWTGSGAPDVGDGAGGGADVDAVPPVHATSTASVAPTRRSRPHQAEHRGERSGGVNRATCPNRVRGAGYGRRCQREVRHPGESEPEGGTRHGGSRTHSHGPRSSCSATHGSGCWRAGRSTAGAIPSWGGRRRRSTFRGPGTIPPDHPLRPAGGALPLRGTRRRTIGRLTPSARRRPGRVGASTAGPVHCWAALILLLPLSGGPSRPEEVNVEGVRMHAHPARRSR